MSATIRWAPTNKGKALRTLAPSCVVQVLREAFGQPPWTLRKADMPVLLGIRFGQKECDREPWDDLLAAVEDHESIEVWAEY